MTFNKSICIHPWNNFRIVPSGKIHPCCFYLDNDTHLFTSDRNDIHWRKIRADMLEGKPVDACQNCYRAEAEGNISERLIYTKDDALPTTTDALPLKYIETSFSNLCNLACVHCSRWCSSTWGAEDHKYNRLTVGRALVEHDVDFEGLDLSQVVELKIIGGEPFMEQRRFIDLMKKLDLKKVTLFVSTNGTVAPNDELKSLMDQCERVIITVSLDGTYNISDWFRWPSKFSEIEEGMNRFESYQATHSHYGLIIKHCVNLYNVWTMDKFAEYLNQHRPQWSVYVNWIDYPGWQSICLMPESAKHTLKEKLKLWSSTIKINLGYGTTDPFLRTIGRLDDTPTSTWAEFLAKTDQLCQERNLDVYSLIPELNTLP